MSKFNRQAYKNKLSTRGIGIEGTEIVQGKAIYEHTPTKAPDHGR